ncbi:MAG: sigma-54 dependent transcriptional regulator [Acidobacteria bacterium]|nr:sigma-54 dependent transcriptional regulator [Acidobacteriota bacterium]
MPAEKILLVDDERLVRWSLREQLTTQGFDVDEAESLAAAERLMAAEFYDLVLLDHRLPDGSGLERIASIVRDFPETAVVMLTAYGTVEGAVRAIKAGANDYLTKPIDGDALLAVVRRVLDTTHLRRELRRLKEHQKKIHGPANLVGRSAAMRTIFEVIGKVAASGASTVLLTGESGSGKDVVAKAIHFASERADRPFMNITCTAVPATLLESELFGHERGAFTDARVGKKGLLELADGGTAFLDEIGDMPPPLQAKLLRFLEDKSFKRVGGTRDIKVDVRIIAATNRNLAEAVRARQFREDLYYRINVVPIALPPLRERREDVALLAQHFVLHFNREFKKNVEGFSRRAMAALERYGWPGNVREMRNVVERMMILEPSGVLELEELPPEIRGEASAADGVGQTFRLPPEGVVLEEVERALVRQALARAGGNRTHAARLLGVSRDTLRYKLKKFRLTERGLGRGGEPGPGEAPEDGGPDG